MQEHATFPGAVSLPETHQATWRYMATTGGKDGKVLTFEFTSLEYNNLVS